MSSLIGLASSCEATKTVSQKEVIQTRKGNSRKQLSSSNHPTCCHPPATSQPTTLPPSHPMQGASQETVTRLFNFMKFVPNPGFRPPKNKK